MGKGVITNLIFDIYYLTFVIIKNHKSNIQNLN